MPEDPIELTLRRKKPMLEGRAVITRCTLPGQSEMTTSKREHQMIRRRTPRAQHASQNPSNLETTAQTADITARQTNGTTALRIAALLPAATCTWDNGTTAAIRKLGSDAYCALNAGARGFTAEENLTTATALLQEALRQGQRAAAERRSAH